MTDDGSVEGTLEVRIEGLQPATDYYIRPYVVLPHAVDGERLYYGAEEMFTTYEADEFFEVPDAVFAAYLVAKFDKNGDVRSPGARRSMSPIWTICPAGTSLR